jgi:hypothetical protein
VAIARRCCMILLIIASLSAARPAVATDVPKIHVFSCQVFSGVLNVLRTDDIGLAVRFENDEAQTIRAIVWRVRYGNQPVDVFDDGTFSPGIRIDNRVLAEQGSTHYNPVAIGAALLTTYIGLPPLMSLTKSNMAFPTYMGTAVPENCAVARVVFADGTTWVNADLDQSFQFLATPAPRASPVPETTPPSSAPVSVTRCILMVGRVTALRIKFRNEHSTPLTHVVFRATYGNSGIDFADNGSFETGALIGHQLRAGRPPTALNGQGYYSFDDPSLCTLVSATYADETTWKNSTIPATPPPLPTAVPDAMPYDAHFHWATRHGYPTPVPTASVAQPNTID